MWAVMVATEISGINLGRRVSAVAVVVFSRYVHHKHVAVVFLIAITSDLHAITSSLARQSQRQSAALVRGVD